jgi:hypothetical protein
MLFLQHTFDALCPGFDRPTLVALQSEAQAELEFWVQLLGPQFSLWGGVRHKILGPFHMVKEGFIETLYTDASVTYGYGAIKDHDVL